MKQFLEKVSILSLSLVLITSFSISSALPAMFDYYQGYSTGQVELGQPPILWDYGHAFIERSSRAYFS